MAGMTKLTPEKKAAFLERLSETANVSAAARRVKISRQSLYVAKRADPAFGDAWQQAVDLGTAALEDEAVRRAKDGTLKPVFYRGVKVGTVREYSDTLLIFLLKARDPDKYAERVRKELTGPGGGPLQHAEVSPEEYLAARRQILDEF